MLKLLPRTDDLLIMSQSCTSDHCLRDVVELGSSFSSRNGRLEVLVDTDKGVKDRDTGNTDETDLSTERTEMREW